MIPTMKKFHERLREARKAAGFSSQAKFAEHVGMIRTNYLLYETGESLPDPSTTLPKLAQGLGIPVSVLRAWWLLDQATDEELLFLKNELEKME